jgi:tetratricopeptide (TPR) repeat protein
MMTNRIEWLQKFLDHNPKDEFSIYALALEYKKLKQMDEALSKLSLCIQINPSNLAAYYQLCEIYTNLNHIELRNKYLSEAKTLAKDLNDLKTLNELISLEDETI